MSLLSFLFKGQTLPDEVEILDREDYKKAIAKGKVQIVDVRTKGNLWLAISKEPRI